MTNSGGNVGIEMATKSATKPRALRLLRAAMEMRELSLRDVSDRSGIDYSTASAILNGRLNYLPALEKIVCAIKNAPAVIDRAYYPPELDAIASEINDPPAAIDCASKD